MSDSSVNRPTWPWVVLFVFVAGISLIGFFSDTLPMNKGTGGLSHSQVEQIVKDTIVKNPDLILEALKILQEKQLADQNKEQERLRKQASVVLKEQYDTIYNDVNAPTIGSDNPDVTIIEFFDYSCGFCKRVFPTISRLLEQDSDLKVVFKEFPILGPQSEYAAKASLAVFRLMPEKYIDFHQALLTNPSRGEQAVNAALEALSIDSDMVKAEMNSPEIQQALDSNRQLASSLGIRGTPAFIIGDEVVPGALTLESFQNYIKKARSQQDAQ